MRCSISIHMILWAAILAGIVVAVNSCAPTIRAIPASTIEDESVRLAREEGKEEGRKEALERCRQELDDRLRDFVRKYRDELLYTELVKGGAILPGQVRLTYNPAKISADGSSYSAPSLVWKIVSPPQFVSDDPGADWLGRDRSNFCYFLVASFNTEAQAFAFAGNSSKPREVFLTIAPHSEGGKWAVIGKTTRSQCDLSISFYKKQGHQAMRIE